MSTLTQITRGTTNALCTTCPEFERFASGVSQISDSHEPYNCLKWLLSNGECPKDAELKAEDQD